MQQEIPMAKMVNVSDHDVVVSIAVGPNRGAHKVTLKPGEVGEFPAGYCRPVRGAGKEPLLPILTRKTMRDGIPTLVPKAEQKEGEARYRQLKAAAAAKEKTPAEHLAALEAENAALRAKLMTGGGSGSGSKASKGKKE